MENIKQFIPEADQLVEFFNLSALPDNEKEQMLLKLSSHLSEVMIETFIDNLDEAQASEIEQLIDQQPEKAQERIQVYASRVPGLSSKIHYAITQELDVLKSGFDQIKKTPRQD